MEVIPTYNHVICTLDEQKSDDIIVYKKETLPIYTIVKIYNSSDDLRYSVNDKIISNSIPTKITLEGKIYYIVTIDNIIGKVY